MELVLVRHGETAYNRADVFRGRSDLTLNDRGRMQARAAGRYLSGTPFAAFYASPLLRSMETAREIAAPHKSEVTPLDGFIDVDYGLWSGRSLDEVRAKWPEEYALWARDPEKVVFPGGESMREVRERLQAGLDRLAESQGGRALLVGHKVINRVIICIILGLTTAGIWRVEQSNGAINIISRDEKGWMLRRMNDTSHLEGIESNDQRT